MQRLRLRPPAAEDRTTRQAVLLSTAPGSLALLAPLALPPGCEAAPTVAALRALQRELALLVPQAAGLNPAAFRCDATGWGGVAPAATASGNLLPTQPGTLPPRHTRTHVHAHLQPAFIHVQPLVTPNPPAPYLAGGGTQLYPPACRAAAASRGRLPWRSRACWMATCWRGTYCSRGGSRRALPRRRAWGGLSCLSCCRRCGERAGHCCECGAGRQGCPDSCRSLSVPQRCRWGKWLVPASRRREPDLQLHVTC